MFLILHFYNTVLFLACIFLQLSVILKLVLLHFLFQKYKKYIYGNQFNVNATQDNKSKHICQNIKVKVLMVTLYHQNYAACTIKYVFRNLTDNLKYPMLYILNEDKLASLREP